MSHNKFRSRARKVQRATGVSYMTCLQLVSGEIAWAPQSEKCAVVAALKEVLGDRYVGPDPDGRSCMCEECDP